MLIGGLGGMLISVASLKSWMNNNFQQLASLAILIRIVPVNLSFLGISLMANTHLFLGFFGPPTDEKPKPREMKPTWLR